MGSTPTRIAVLLVLVLGAGCSGDSGTDEIAVLGEELSGRQFSEANGWILSVQKEPGASRDSWTLECVADIAGNPDHFKLELALGRHDEPRAFDLRRMYASNNAGAELLLEIHSCEFR